ncbi:neprilysin-like [Dermacentor variabilis]|uniref:neprilysin-like n=1 Tax=Dermacentor variabilis TaxID=34621 RepID=UPI003F5B1DF3
MSKGAQKELQGASGKKGSGYGAPSRKLASELLATTTTTTTKEAVPDFLSTAATSGAPANEPTLATAASPVTNSTKARNSAQRPEASATAEQPLRRSQSAHKASQKPKLKPWRLKSKSTFEKTENPASGVKNAQMLPLPKLEDQQRQAHYSSSGVELAPGRSKASAEETSKQPERESTAVTGPGRVGSSSYITSSGLTSPGSDQKTAQARETSPGKAVPGSILASPRCYSPRRDQLRAQTTIAGPGYLAPAVKSPRAAATAEGNRKPGPAADVSPASKALRDLASFLMISPIKFTNISKNNQLKKSVVGFLAAAVIVTVMVAVVGLAILSHEHTKREIYCETEGCLFHARLLTKNLNKTIDPCEDFSAYVCSAWSRSGDYREQVKTPIDDILYNRFVGFSKMLAAGTEKLPAGLKAVAMHTSCMDSYSRGNTRFENFRRLMKAMSLSWPEQPGENVNALGVMLSLSYKWQITIWIMVSGKEAYWRLGIGPAKYIPLLKNHYASVRSSGGYPQYWNGYYHALRTSASQPLDKPAIERIADAEGDILGRLLRPLAATEKHPAVVPIASMGNVTASLSPSTWLEQLNLHLDLGPKVAADDRVLVSDTAFLAAFGDLFARYSHQQLLSHLSWLFVQTYAPILDQKLHLARFGDSEKANLYKPIFCAFHVESTFKMLVFALNYVSGFTKSDKKKVITAFGRLMSVGVRELNSSTWLDEESKTSAAEKLASVQVVLWPGPLWLGNEFLRTLYSDFPINEPSFGDDWIKARLAIAKMNRTEHLEATLRLPSNFPPPTYRYDYIRNNIEIPIGIVDKPLFYKDGTKAMFYGGLGFLIALEMVRALDKIGLHWNEDGRETTSILSGRSIKYFEEKDACRKDEGSISIFPEVPAVEIAYAALSEAIREDKDALTIRDLPEEKVFFMTLCFMMCKAREANRFGGVDCHKVIRNSPLFHKLFNCPEGSKMNPTKKCSFFRDDIMESSTEHPTETARL